MTRSERAMIERANLRKLILKFGAIEGDKNGSQAERERWMRERRARLCPGFTRERFRQAEIERQQEARSIAEAEAEAETDRHKAQARRFLVSTSAAAAARLQEIERTENAQTEAAKHDAASERRSDGPVVAPAGPTGPGNHADPRLDGEALNQVPGGVARPGPLEPTWWVD